MSDTSPPPSRSLKAAHYKDKHGQTEEARGKGKTPRGYPQCFPHSEFSRLTAEDRFSFRFTTITIRKSVYYVEGDACNGSPHGKAHAFILCLQASPSHDFCVRSYTKWLSLNICHISLILWNSVKLGVVYFSIIFLLCHNEKVEIKRLLSITDKNCMGAQ